MVHEGRVSPQIQLLVFWCGIWADPWWDHLLYIPAGPQSQTRSMANHIRRTWGPLSGYFSHLGREGRPAQARFCQSNWDPEKEIQGVAGVGDFLRRSTLADDHSHHLSKDSRGASLENELLHLKQIALPVSVLSTYTTTLVRNSGYSSSNAALLNIPNGFVGIIAAVIVGYSVRHTSYRWAIPGVLGGGLMSFLPVDNHAGLIAGIYIISTITPTLLLIYQWTASNIAGHAKGGRQHGAHSRQFQRRQHCWASDLSREGRAWVFTCEDYAHGYAGCWHCVYFLPFWLLCLG